MNLRDYAKGKPCMIRVPGICSFDKDQTVLCHARMVEIPHENGKLPDLLAAFGCSPCHDIVDGRAGSWKVFNRETRRLMLLEGVMRTQSYLVKHGIVSW